MKSSDYICPHCATFNLKIDKGYYCSTCGHTPRTHHLKITNDYAYHVYLYGHAYRKNYQNQVNEKGDISLKMCLEPDSIYKFIGLAMLSGVVGNLAWDIVKTAAYKIINSYNNNFNKSFSITETELHEIYKSFDLFIKHADEIDKKVMDGIVEEMFAHGSSKKHGKKFVVNYLTIMASDNTEEKNKLEKENQQLMKKFSKEIMRNISKLKKAENEEFESYWGKIKIE